MPVVGNIRINSVGKRPSSCRQPQQFGNSAACAGRRVLSESTSSVLRCQRPAVSARTIIAEATSVEVKIKISSLVYKTEVACFGPRRAF